MKKINRFKDKCDICGHFDYCKGNNGLLLCPKCLKNKQNENNKKSFYPIVGELNEQTRFVI